MAMPDINYEFLSKAGRILSLGQSRSIMLTGNVPDLFYIPGDKGGRYVPLIEWMTERWNLPGENIIIVYELNSPIMFAREADREKMKNAWLKHIVKMTDDELAIKKVAEPKKIDKLIETQGKYFESTMKEADSNSKVAIELLRQFCECSRSTIGGKQLMKETLLIIIDGIDMMIPPGEISRMGEGDRYRIGAFQNWFSDPKFMSGRDSVIMTAESKSLVNRIVANLPQIIEVEIPSPNQEARKHFISWFNEQQPEGSKIQLWNNGTEDELAKSTAALSIHALMQLLKGANFGGRKLEQRDVIDKVGDYIKSQLGGEDIVEFKKPTHPLDDVVGYRKLKQFFVDELIPWFNSTGSDALTGVGVCGPLGSGKTYQFEAVASMLGRVVLVLKNFRSKWFGESDVIIERLKRILYALDKALVFVDEADTAFGGVSKETHETERRLTGKFQAMMSDTALRGKVIWLLMTARIHLLSPDMRRPGRLDLIIPILDPEGEDRTDFLKWVLSAGLQNYKEEDIKALDELTKGFSAASFDVIRRLVLRDKRGGRKLDINRVKEIVKDYIPPAIGETRRYQTLQALVNCTRRSLLPNPDATDEDRKLWAAEIKLLEARGITGD